MGVLIGIVLRAASAARLIKYLLDRGVVVTAGVKRTDDGNYTIIGKTRTWEAEEVDSRTWLIPRDFAE